MARIGLILFGLVGWRLVFLGFGRGFPIPARVRSKSRAGGSDPCQAARAFGKRVVNS